MSFYRIFDTGSIDGNILYWWIQKFMNSLALCNYHWSSGTWEPMYIVNLFIFFSWKANKKMLWSIVLIFFSMRRTEFGLKKKKKQKEEKKLNHKTPIGYLMHSEKIIFYFKSLTIDRKLGLVIWLCHIARS